MKYIEVPYFILLFAFIISDPISINLITYRTCYLTLSFNETECARLGSKNHDNATIDLEKLVQPHVTFLTTTKSLIETIIPSIFCIFLGPWSDKFGRRPVLLYSLAAYTLAYATTTIISALPVVSPWFFLLSCIPICLSGGFPIILTATICYITDTTTTENRGVRMGIFEALTTGAFLFGNLASPFVFNSYGYVITYIITTSCVFLSWLTATIAIAESVEQPETEGKLRSLFKISLVTDTISTTFRKREGCDRTLLLCVITVLVVFLFVSIADSGIVFLYLRNKLHWSLEKFTIFSSYRSLPWAAGSIIGGYFLHKLLHVKEGPLILLGFLSTFSSVLVQGLATEDWHMYLAAGIKCFGGVISPMTRSLISKTASVVESGRVFSFVVMTETLVSLIGRPLYALIYNHTLTTLPGLFNFVTAGIYVFEIVVTIFIIIMQHYQGRSDYCNLSNEGVSNA